MIFSNINNNEHFKHLEILLEIFLIIGYFIQLKIIQRFAFSVLPYIHGKSHIYLLHFYIVLQLSYVSNFFNSKIYIKHAFTTQLSLSQRRAPSVVGGEEH